MSKLLRNSYLRYHSF